MIVRMKRVGVTTGDGDNTLRSEGQFIRKLIAQELRGRLSFIS